MFSATELPGVLDAGIIGFALGGAATDILWGRIFNWMNGLGLMLGLVASFWTLGWPGVGDGLLGAACGLLAYGWLFWCGAMGGGDVKFLAVLGVWGGWYFTLEVALLAIVLGGALGICQLAAKGRLKAFGARIYHFVLTVTLKDLEAEPLMIDRKLQLPYGVAIASAAVWIALGHPFEWLRAHL